MKAATCDDCGEVYDAKGSPHECAGDPELDQAFEQVQRLGLACDAATERAEKAEARVAELEALIHAYRDGCGNMYEGMAAAKALVVESLRLRPADSVSDTKETK